MKVRTIKRRTYKSLINRAVSLYGYRSTRKSALRDMFGVARTVELYIQLKCCPEATF